MIIAKLDLKAYGRFSDVTLDLSAGPRRFHLVYGPNESGKSTSLRAITSLLFGIPHITDDNFLHANNQLRIGGRLIDGTRTLDCVRRKGKKATLRDANDDEVVDEAIIQRMLGGISRETFLSRYGLSHEELVAGGDAIVSGEGDLGQILFSAGAGIGRLRTIRDELETSAAAIFTPRGSKTAVARSLQQLDEQRGQLKRAQIPPSEYRDLRERLESDREESKQLTIATERSTRELHRLRSYQQALPLGPRWRSTIEELKGLRTTPRLDEAFTERRRQAIADREVAKSRRTELQGRITEMNSRLAEIPVDALILRHQVEIQALFQEVASRNKAERDRNSLLRTRENLDRKIAALLSQLSIEMPRLDDDSWPVAMELAIDGLKISESNRTRIRKLTASYEKLISQRNDASDHVETTQRRLSDIADETDSLDVPNDPVVISTAIEAIGNPQALLESIGDQKDSNESLLQRCEHLRARLVGFDGTLNDAAALTLPSVTRLQTLGDSINNKLRQRDELEKQRLEIRAERDTLARQLQHEQAELPLPTTQELLRARNDRDATADELKSRAARVTTEDRLELVDIVERLSREIQTTDQLAETIQAHHQQFHQRQQIQHQLDRLDERCELVAENVAEATSALSEANQQWTQAWAECSVTPGEPERMQRWVTDHELLCQTLTQLRDGEKRMEQLQNRTQVAVTRLRKALSSKPNSSVRVQQAVGASLVQGGLFDDAPEDDLIALYDEALEARGEASRKRQQFDALRRRREELAEELPRAEIRLETAQRDVEQWREDWQRATESLNGEAKVGTEEVTLMLDQITDLHNKKRERDILARRIHSIGNDDEDFETRLQQIVTATQSEFSGERSATGMAQDLYQRVQVERTAAQTRDTLREQIDLSKQRMAEAESQQASCEAVLAQLCDEAGCKSAEDLPAIERAATQRNQLESELRELENQLSILAGEIPINDFIDTACAQQAGELDHQITELETTIKQQQQQQSALQQQIGASQHELRKIDGSGNASELIQSIQFTTGELNRDCEEYARTKIASLILQRAIDHYRSEHQSPILNHANKFFRKLTCEDYRELRPDYDSKGRTTLIGIQDSGDAVPAAMMSDGTADALYLALRLASLEYQIGLSTPIPLIIDDCLIQLDDQRAAAALGAFSDLSETTQIILFTHHQHIIELAAKHLSPGDCHIHRFDQPHGFELSS